MSHLEQLLAEYYDWRGYLLKRNTRVGKLARGGWEMELDIIAYHPHTNDLVHLEPSLDADSWATREKRFEKKFSAGRKYVFSEIFTWLDPKTPLRQVAVLVSKNPDRSTLAGAAIRTVDEYMTEIREVVRAEGVAATKAIPEQYPLLRTIQLVVSGYYRLVGPESDSASL